MLIERLTDIDKLWKIQNNFQEKNNIKPLNVSDWNCSFEFKNNLLDVFEAPQAKNYVDYIYSYSLEDSQTKKLKGKYPFIEEQKREIVITPNNTVSILYVVNFLKQIQVKNICIISPTYFSVYNALITLGINYDIVRLQHKENNFFLSSKMDLSKFDAVWITSPVFCNGSPIDKTTMKMFEELSKDKIIITDESFCGHGNELPNKHNFKNHIGVYCPHKSIGFNAFKFSMITLNDTYMDVFEHWSDVLCGSLNLTNINAIAHFLSDNFNVCQNSYDSFIDHARDLARETIQSNPNLLIDTNSSGNMMMVYANTIPYSKMYDVEFFEKLMKKTAGSFIPGYLHDYIEDYGFCFRVNLSLFNNHFLNILKNICMFLG